MLEAKGLSVRAGNFTLEGINLQIQEGHFHVIIGPTGSGKTVLLETVMGFKIPFRGEIWFNGVNITNVPVELRGISYLPQDLALFPHLSVKGNIFYSMKLKGIKDRKYHDLADDLINMLDIRHLLDRPIHNLSGGERQRVAMVRAVASGNKYLLLDEPFSALHEGMKKELWFLLKEIQERYHLTVVMITHDVEEAFLLANTISIIIDGKIEQTGKNEDVYHRPATIGVARFFGIRNLFDAEIIGKNTVRCKELEADIIVKSPLPQTTSRRLTLGIRAEDVMILRPDLRRPERGNILEGVIADVFRKGATDIVLFKPLHIERLIEIEMPFYAFQKLNITKGTQASAILKNECIFLIYEEPAL